MERGGFEPPVSRGPSMGEIQLQLGALFGPTKRICADRISSPGIRLCYYFLRFASFTRLKADAL